jgi:FdhE protein
MSSAVEQWISSHPYLGKLAEFQHMLDSIFQHLSAPELAAPAWESCAAGYREGLPLLENPEANLAHHRAAADLLLAAARKLAVVAPATLHSSATELLNFLEASVANRLSAIEWVEGRSPEGFTPVAPGLLRVLGWRAILRTLAPVLASYAEWRGLEQNDEQWMRGWCPVCGAPPAMAQITPDGTEPRSLVCGCCHTLWQYLRIGCPYCENQDQNKLFILNIAEEPLFRLDHCGECNGYLKTFNGVQDLDLHLSDWSTVHLDLLARSHKLERKAPILFEV